MNVGGGSLMELYQHRTLAVAYLSEDPPTVRTPQINNDCQVAVLCFQRCAVGGGCTTAEDVRRHVAVR